MARALANPEATKARFKDWYERRYDQYKDIRSVRWLQN
jgi:hypothetical protein